MIYNVVLVSGVQQSESVIPIHRSNPPILKEISPEYSLKGLMLKLKLQNFVHLMQRTNSLENSLMLGKIEGTSIFEGESERNDRV